MEIIKRKRRTDRNHAVYALFCITSGETYIGVTVLSHGIKTSIKRRFKSHVSRAKTENKSWRLCEALRAFGEENFKPYLLQIVRGKTEAHLVERGLINLYKPTLNTW
jgi:hypothetical protein